MTIIAKISSMSDILKHVKRSMDADFGSQQDEPPKKKLKRSKNCMISFGDTIHPIDELCEQIKEAKVEIHPTCTICAQKSNFNCSIENNAKYDGLDCDECDTSILIGDYFFSCQEWKTHVIKAGRKKPESFELCIRCGIKQVYGIADACEYEDDGKLSQVGEHGEDSYESEDGESNDSNVSESIFNSEGGDDEGATHSSSKYFPSRITSDDIDPSVIDYTQDSIDDQSSGSDSSSVAISATKKKKGQKNSKRVVKKGKQNKKGKNSSKSKNLNYATNVPRKVAKRKAKQARKEMTPMNDSDEASHDDLSSGQSVDFNGGNEGKQEDKNISSKAQDSNQRESIQTLSDDPNEDDGFEVLSPGNRNVGFNFYQNNINVNCHEFGAVMMQQSKNSKGESDNSTINTENKTTINFGVDRSFNQMKKLNEMSQKSGTSNCESAHTETIATGANVEEVVTSGSNSDENDEFNVKDKKNQSKKPAIRASKKKSQDSSRQGCIGLREVASIGSMSGTSFNAASSARTSQLMPFELQSSQELFDILTTRYDEFGKYALSNISSLYLGQYLNCLMAIQCHELRKNIEKTFISSVKFYAANLILNVKTFPGFFFVV